MINITGENFVLVGALLLFVAVVAGKVAYRFGAPALLLFLGVGMLFGWDFISYRSVEMTQFVGMLALCVILFTGGMDTAFSEIRPVIGPGVVLATAGVVMTALVMATFVWLVAPWIGIEMPFALALLLGGLWLLRRWLAARGKGLGDLFRPAPPQPPHVVAIRALEALHHQKLWQNNRHKQYYSGITEILRTYIAGRWGIGAMEMTSDEIIAAMRGVELPDKASMDLTAILRDADLVKFAKDTPDAEQNEADYLKAYYFVEETKLVEESEAANPESEPEIE